MVTHESHLSRTMKKWLSRVRKSTPKVAIPAINAQDGTSNIVDENQTIYHLDPNCDQGIEPITILTSTKLIICLDKSASAPAVAIPAIPAINVTNAQDSAFNVAGRDQTFVTNIYNVDPNCDQGIGSINHTTSTKLII